MFHPLSRMIRSAASLPRYSRLAHRRRRSRFQSRPKTLVPVAGILICMVFIISAAATAATVEMVTVGDPGNAPDPSTGGRFGAVAYQYRIGKYEVTLGEYTAFLNAVAKSNPYGLFTPDLQSADLVGGIARSGHQANYALGGVYAMTQSVNVVAGQSYTSGGGGLSNTASSYGTFDHHGNVSEWNELIGGTAASFNMGTPGGLRGGREGSWRDTDSSQIASTRRGGFSARASGGNVGFRLAGAATAPAPEIDPNSLGSEAALLAGVLGWLERRRGPRRASRYSRARQRTASAELLAGTAWAAVALAAAMIIGRPVAAATTDTVQYLSSPSSYGAVGNGLNLEFGTKAFPPLAETALEAYQVQGSGPVTLTFRMHADTGTFRFNFGYYKYLPALNSIDTSTTAGKQAYATTALAAGNAVLVFNDVIHDPGATTTKTVNGGDLLGFFLIPDDTLANFQTSPGSFAVTGVGSATFGIGGPKRWPFFGYAAANPGGKDQLMSFAGTSKATGKRSNMFAWEDISRAALPGDFVGDNAFNDLIFAVEGVEAAATTPSAIPEIDPGSVAGVAALVIATLAWIERRRR